MLNLHNNPSSGKQVVPFGRTDKQTNVTELTVAFCDLSNAPKNPDKISKWFYPEIPLKNKLK